MIRGAGALSRGGDRRGMRPITAFRALAAVLWVQALALPALAQTQPDVVVQEFTGTEIPGVNYVWAGALIGIAIIVLVAQHIIHRLALRREVDARGNLSRQLIDARER